MVLPALVPAGVSLTHLSSSDTSVHAYTKSWRWSQNQILKVEFLEISLRFGIRIIPELVPILLGNTGQRAFRLNCGRGWRTSCYRCECWVLLGDDFIEAVPRICSWARSSQSSLFPLLSLSSLQLPGFFLKTHDYGIYSENVEFVNEILHLRTR